MTALLPLCARAAAGWTWIARIDMPLRRRRWELGSRAADAPVRSAVGYPVLFFARAIAASRSVM